MLEIPTKVICLDVHVRARLGGSATQGKRVSEWEPGEGLRHDILKHKKSFRRSQVIRRHRRKLAAFGELVAPKKALANPTLLANNQRKLAGFKKLVLE